jgi:diguanylate cyclase (GGDEF)-like protein
MARADRTMNTEKPEMPFYDALTGLHNRSGFMLLAGHEHRVQQRNGLPAALFRIDVEGLDRISDEHGRDESDAVLVAIGDLLRMTFRDADIAAHMGSGRFAVLAIGCEAIEALRRRLHAHVAEYSELFPRPYALAVNIHATPLAGDPAQPVETLLAQQRSAETH